MNEKETFLLTEGKVKLPLAEENASNLAFAIEEGYSDQNISAMYEIVEADAFAFRKKLKDAGVDV